MPRAAKVFKAARLTSRWRGIPCRQATFIIVENALVTRLLYYADLIIQEAWSLLTGVLK